MAKIDATLATLEGLAATHDRVLVAYSDGKDSRIVMDLAVRLFPQVAAFYMYFAPGLPHIEARMAEAEARYGVKIARYPHWSFIAALKMGIYCDARREFDDLPNLKLKDIYHIAMAASGASILLTGAKKTDSPWRRKFMHSTRHWDFVVNPIADWTKHDVTAYLQARKIPLPPAEKGNATGVDLTYESVLWLHDTYPDDYAVLAGYFPYVQALIERRRLYGK